MAQFDVYELQVGKTSLFVVEIQSNLLSELGTTVVVPLKPLQEAKNELTTRLKPIVNLSGSPYVFMATDVSAILRGKLSAPVQNIEAQHRDDIIGALDFLISGF